MKDFSELTRTQRVIEQVNKYGEVRVLGKVEARGQEFPVYSFILGSKDPTKPTLGLFGGVHGLERIGSQTVLAYFESLFEQLSWDQELQERFRDLRLVSIPIINPAGMYFGYRSNMNGVDLMRNSPVEAVAKPGFLIGGHRISPKLPWYRGSKEQPKMELESQILVDFVKKEMFSAEVSIALDIHSGFGLKDRLWYPYAKTTETFPRIKEVEAFSRLLNKSYPNHVYLVEPQAASYTTHGDLWDHLFDEHVAFHGAKAPLFLPWTLEMGSWIWVRKNPVQVFSPISWFNPVKEHRIKRAMRRHIPLIDFFLRAVKNYRAWTETGT